MWIKHGRHCIYRFTNGRRYTTWIYIWNILSKVYLSMRVTTQTIFANGRQSTKWICIGETLYQVDLNMGDMYNVDSPAGDP